MKYLLDADIFSYMVRGDRASVNQRMEKLKAGEAGLSVITLGEYWHGLAHAAVSALRQQRAQRLSTFFETLALDASVAKRYGELRAHLRAAGTPIGPNDLWLAAHALNLNLILVTNNTREFERVPRLKLENWLQ